MIPAWKIFGRLGNSMFQYAFLYAYARDKGIDFYFQDIKFFKKYASEIKALFGQGIIKLDQVGIHVRRGDYVNNPMYVDLMKTGYYERAMEQFKGESFLVFSDDIEWCKEQEIFRGCEFSKGNDEIGDMNLLAGCKGIIMANSSFSWWCAFLSDAKVIAPKEWYRDGVERTKCLPEWTRM